MSKRYSERPTETFRDDELSKLNGTGINGRYGGRSKTPRQSVRKREPPDVPADTRHSQSIPL